jgi:hypothetical protein
MRENLLEGSFGEESGSDYDTDDADLWTDSDSEDWDSSSLPQTAYEDALPAELAGLKLDMTTNLDLLARGDENSEKSVSSLDLDETDDEEDNAPAPKKKNAAHSIAHKYFEEDRIVFISLDLETGGDRCGILQLSAEICSPDGTRLGGELLPGEVLPDGKRDGIFDSYIKPPASAIWNNFATEIHGLHKDHPVILEAEPIGIVWPKFVSHVEKVLKECKKGTKGVIVAWNGKSCDMEWLYRITQGVDSVLRMPKRCDFFLDPFNLIRYYTGCKLNQRHSKVTNLSLSCVYKYATGENLDNAHNSLYDAMAQTTILLDERVKGYWDKSKAIVAVEQIWGKKTESRAKQLDEPTRNVQDPWKADGDAETWDPNPNQKYTGHGGGGRMGPSSQVAHACRGSDNLSSLFLFLFPLYLLRAIAKSSNKYANTDWVVEAKSRDRDGEVKKRRTLKPCKKSDEGARHRAQGQDAKIWKITPGFLIAWLGILYTILHGRRTAHRLCTGEMNRMVRAVRGL